nr:3'-5' exonuclease [Granulicella arctica]
MLGDLPVGRLQLTANFRSQRALVEQVNEDFALLFPSAATSAHPEDVPFAEAKATRPPTDAQGRVWHPHTIAKDAPNGTRKRQAAEDALEIRRIAEGWRARPLPPGRTEPWKIGVLVRSRGHLGEIVTALKQDGGNGSIPFRAVDIELLSERQEVLDLFALTRALLHPADRVAWLSILRAPWCGLTLADLHLLAGADDPAWAETSVEELISRRGDLLSPDGCQRLERIWSVMQAAAKRRSRLTYAQWVERSWRSLGGDAYLSETELANAHRYLQLLDELEAETETIRVDQLDQRLTKLYAEAAVHPGAIDLMTIHGSKGLEWDVVIVPSLERKGQSSRGRLLTWLELDSTDADSAHVVLAPILGKGEASRELNDWLNSIHNAREAAERKRLYYVACTRAREELHLFASPERTSKGAISIQQDSLLKAAWPAAERHFADTESILAMMPAALPERESVIDIAAEGMETQRPQLLHRLPADFNASKRFAQHLPLSDGTVETRDAIASFERPEGSFAARAFGNAVHSFLELLAQRIAEDHSINSLLAELPRWTPRIAALLRGDGLPPAMVERLAQRVRVALENTLKDPEGQWVLARHLDAASEHALTQWKERHASIRIDRIFRAGAEPLAPGADYLWIVDFKTTTHGRDGVDAFLLKEREKYASQMETYARILTASDPQNTRIRMMLYYPLIPSTLWWSSTTT